MKIIKVNEGTSTIQIVCPYCNKIQITSTALHVIHIPVDFWKCEFCGKIGRGIGLKKDLKKCHIPESGAIYVVNPECSTKKNKSFIKDTFQKICNWFTKTN